MTRLVGGSHTDVGRVRSANQDAALARAAAGLYAVADGMGGHRGGEVASAMALQALEHELASVRVGAGPVDSVDTVVDAVLAANEAVYAEASTTPELHGMGTTLCVLALTGAPGQQQVAVANVGDSRVYVLHEGELAQLTEDHSLVQGLVRDGQLTADEAAVHPNRNILTRVIGVEPDVEVDWWEWPATVGDRYLLCSDGLFNEVHHERIAATLRQLADPAEACRELVALANAAGGRDNVTAVVVDVLDDNGPASVPPDPGATAATTLATALGPSAAAGDHAGRAGRTSQGGQGGGTAAGAGGESTAALALSAPGVVGSGRAEDGPGRGRNRRAGWRRRLTPRVGLFLVVLAGLVAVAWVAIGVWADRNFFVGAADGSVVVYRGRPDGVLWFRPEVVQQTDIALSELTDAQLQVVQEHPPAASVAEALDLVRRQTATLTTSTTILRRPTTTTTTTTTTKTTTTTPAVPSAVPNPVATAPRPRFPPSSPCRPPRHRPPSPRRLR